MPNCSYYRRPTRILSYGLFLTICSLFSAQGQVALAHIFSDHMVLQREQPIKIWGWATAGEAIEVSMASQSATTTANSQGNWEVILKALPAGGPHEVSIKGKNTIELKDVLVGDLWLASGQSNMEWRISSTPFTETDSTLLHENQIRLFTVQIETDYLPRNDVKGGPWLNLTSENINKFSAVAYHFGKFIHREIDVPIGIINSSLGATSVEAWMSNESLMDFDQFAPEISPILSRGKSSAQINDEFAANQSHWEKEGYLTGPGIDQKWYLPTTDVSDWKDIEVPGYWEDKEYEDHDGAMWYRKTFDLPDATIPDSFLIQLTQIDDYDRTWVNGIEIGETFGRHNFRNYWVPKSALKSKDNVITVRAFDVGGKGGFSTNAFWLTGMIRGTWQCKPGLKINVSTFRTMPSVNISPFSSPGVLYNANIAPLTKLPIKGAIWYQGESNASRAYEYRSLFKGLISDWRDQWSNPELPFFFVQLANYNPESETPGQSDWAELREAQTMALALPKTGMAVTIDIGEANDIHPRNKVDVGKRLGLAALKVAYDRDIVFQGPAADEVFFTGDQVTVTYSNVGSGLISRDKFGYIRGFELAGTDQKFHWAKAEIIDGEVRAFSSEVAEPVAIRYDWSNNPGQVDLYNVEGLPALPFRSDNWPGATTDRKFNHLDARF